MSRLPLLTGSPQAFLAWGRIFLLPALVLSFSGTTAAGAQGKYFRVEMLSPQYFRITSLVQGPVSSHLIGGMDSRQLISRQENGKTIIFVRVPLGATLTIRVGDYRLRLWMKNSSSFETEEECRPLYSRKIGMEAGRSDMRESLSDSVSARQFGIGSTEKRRM